MSAAPEVMLQTHDEQPFALADAIREHAGLVLLPFRGHW